MMTNPDQNNLSQTANESSNSHVQNEAELFCRVMTELNGVALEQTKGLLEIAVTAAEKIHALGSARSQPAESSAAVDEIKTRLENLDRRSQESLESISSAPDGEHNLTQSIEQAMHLAVNNSVTNQQQLNIIGASILAQAANLLLGNRSAE